MELRLSVGNFQKRKRTSGGEDTASAYVQTDNHTASDTEIPPSPVEPVRKFAPPTATTRISSEEWRRQKGFGRQYRGRRHPDQGGKTPKTLRLPQDVIWMLDRLKELMGQPYNDIASEAIRDLWHKRYAGIYKDTLQQPHQGY